MNINIVTLQHNKEFITVIFLVSGQPPSKSRHLDELTHEPAIWSCDTGQWLPCFDSCQLTIL